LRELGGTAEYSSEFSQGVNPTVAQCNDWAAYIDGLVVGDYTTLTVMSSLGTTFVCSDPLVIDQIIVALQDNTLANTIDVQFPCDGNNWSVTGWTSFCGGSGNWISLPNNGDDCTNDFAIRPSLGNNNWGGSGGTTCFAPTQTLSVIFGGGDPIATGGCNTMVTNDAGPAPDFCGGSSTVTWTVTSDCEDDIMSTATFTVDPAPAVVLTVPTDATETECQTQADVDAAFTAWLATASVAGGCTPILSDDSAAAPDFCGGEVTVTWTVRCLSNTSRYRCGI